MFYVVQFICKIGWYCFGGYINKILSIYCKYVDSSGSIFRKVSIICKKRHANTLLRVKPIGKANFPL